MVSLVVAVGACTSTRQSSDAVDAAGDGPVGGPVDVQSVAVIGDSLTAGSSAAIGTALTEAGYQPLLIDGEPSRRSVVDSDGGPISGLSALGNATANGNDPDAWVVALGTNDVLQYASTDEYAGVISELSGAIPEGEPLVWVDVYLRDYVTEAAAFNGTLHSILDARPSTVVIDWSSRASANGVLSDDGIHPTTDGQQAFADTIVAGVAALSG